jgi:hydrogenase-4 component B
MTAGVLVVAGSLLGLGAATAGASLPKGWRVPAAAALIWAACGCEAAAAIHVLAIDRPIVLRSTELLPLTGVTLVLNPLGAFFVLLVVMVAVPATLYGIGYADHGLDTRTAACVFPLFVTTLLLVPSAGSVATFMALWELMALTSLLLVLVDHGHNEASRSAGTWYAVLTHVGAATILVGLLILAAHSGGQTFAAIAVHARHLASGVRALVFLLALVGFGSKAGVVPFHVWLPKAHPEAPSPVSALMSGAMVALGVYGIVLVGNDLLGGGPVWWWLVVLVLGGGVGAVRFIARGEQHRLEAPAGLFHHRQHRAGPSRRGRRRTLRRHPAPSPGGIEPGIGPRAAVQPRRLQGRPLSVGRVGPGGHGEP